MKDDAATGGRRPALAAEKTALRRRVKAELASLDARAFMDAGRAAALAARDLAPWREAAALLAFLPMPAEIDTSFLVAASLAAGKTVAVPRIAPDGLELEFVPLAPDYRSWPPDRWDIPSPPSSLAALDMASLAREPLFVAVPGLAFDLAGGRLGRGKGFYDRFLARLLRIARAPVFLCGLCLSGQLVDRVPREEHDLRVDALAGDYGLRLPSKRS